MRVLRIKSCVHTSLSLFLLILTATSCAYRVRFVIPNNSRESYQLRLRLKKVLSAGEFRDQFLAEQFENKIPNPISGVYIYDARTPGNYLDFERMDEDALWKRAPESQFAYKPREGVVSLRLDATQALLVEVRGPGVDNAPLSVYSGVEIKTAGNSLYQSGSNFNGAFKKLNNRLYVLGF